MFEPKPQSPADRATLRTVLLVVAAIEALSLLIPFALKLLH
jgi:hypothetical protein